MFDTIGKREQIEKLSALINTVCDRIY